ncbi:MAG TPA: DUF362 domain-containing protein [Candidatus Latescibacteria bacterium]|nr:DUF362 domain-containing protein [Candidatus Latescibacterota bacterium]
MQKGLCYYYPTLVIYISPRKEGEAMEVDDSEVLVCHTPRSEEPRRRDFEEAGYLVLQKLRPEPKEVVLIKPNVIPQGTEDSGMITHPWFVAGMVQYFREAGAREVVVGEGGWERTHWRKMQWSTENIWRSSGYREMADATGVRLVDLEEEGEIMGIPGGKFTKTLLLSRWVRREEGFFVDVPKMKTHNLAVTTLCTKNLMGAVLCPDRHFCFRARAHSMAKTGSLDLYESSFAELLIDLVSVVQPDLCVVEGVVGRDGTAFHRGENLRTWTVVAGHNPVTVDAYTSYLMGFKPRAISYLREAEERGLGEIEPGRIRARIQGDPLPSEGMGFQVISWDGRNHPELYLRSPASWKYPEGKFP